MNIIKNSRINIIDDDDVLQYNECKLFAGIVYLFKSFSTNNFINVIPVFAQLTPNSLCMFLGLNSKTLFFEIKTSKIERITQTIKNTLCFDIVSNQNVKNEYLNIGNMTICLKSAAMFHKWIKNIQVFKACKGNSASSKKINEPQKRVIADFTNINQLMAINPLNKLTKNNGLYYPNTKAYPISSKTIHSKIVIKKQLKKIMRNIRKGKLEQKVILRKMKNKVRKEKQKVDKIMRNQQLIKHILHKQKSSSRRMRYRILNKEKSIKARKLLQAINHRIKTINQNSAIQIQQSYTRKLKQIQSRAKLANQDLLLKYEHRTRLLPPDKCTHINLTST